MQYSESYMLSKDIDWFFKVNKRYVHVASAGGLLPTLINNKEKLRMIQYMIFNLPYIYSEKEIIINHDFILQTLSQQENDEEQSYDQYLESFIHFARKGFISMDRSYINDPLNNLYHVVCAPRSFKNILQIDSIPEIENNEFHIDIFDGDVFRDNNLNNIQLLNLF